MDGLWLELLALAVAGCRPLSNLPKDPSKGDALIPEKRGSDGNFYVSISLTTMIKYYERAKTESMKIPYNQRFRWLKETRRAERAVWMDRYRRTRVPLGQIVGQVFIERDPRRTMHTIAGSSTSESSSEVTALKR